MPYIPDRGGRRAALRSGSVTPENMGELTYVLTTVAIRYVEAHGRRFQTFGEVLGALQATSLEFYRRRVADYEDEKIEENGDVYY
jgi:hypothetical protein